MRRAQAHTLNGPVNPKDTARRTLLVCLIVMLIPVLLCLGLYTVYSSHAMEQEIFRNMQMSVEQAKNNMDTHMAQLERSALRILSHIYAYLDSDADYGEQLMEYFDISQLLTESQNQNSITKLRLYVPSEKCYSRQHDTFYSLKDLELELDDGELRAGSFWQETHPIAIHFGYPQVPVISCVSAVSSIHRYGHVVGVLFLDMDVEPFENMLSTGIAEEAKLFIVNRKGVVLIHPDHEQYGTNPFQKAGIDDLSPDAMRAARIGQGRDRQLMVSRRLNAADWYLVMTVPATSVYSAGIFSLDIIRAILLLLIFVSLVVALVMTNNTMVRNTVRRINRAINNTIDTMQKGGLAPIEGDKTVDHGDPSLAALEHNTNLMAATITQLLESRYQDQLMVRDFQMQALQAQINPHFLYNTLDIIKWMIADGQNEDGIWMINALSRYFQLSLSSGRDIVCVGEEIRLTRTYIGIMQRRFKGVFTAEFDVEPELEDCLIPKLSLQPIVENALLHGILYAQKPEKTIRVRVMGEEGQLIIEIEDNGNGIDEETVAAILRCEQTHGKGYGLSNVIRRLRLFGAGKDDFQINSQSGIGTCVTVVLPMRRAPQAEPETDAGGA